ncbi:MAG: TlpA disulfide reductase family protein [Cardiobacteriaceae bacterium]|nr:TlpA disulfide reductase family protein [Cardiobacteriaceae bacterium]
MMSIRKILRLIPFYIGMLCLNAYAQDCPLPEGFIATSTAIPLNEITHHAGKQRITLLNIWAIWCAPCRKELPLLDALAQQKDTPLEIITINLGDDPSQIEQLYQDLNIKTLPRYNDGSSDLLKKLEGVGLPLSVWFVDGHSIAKSTGALKNSQDLLNYSRCLAQMKAKKP